ncbi:MULTISPECIES: flagellar biosynthetic protein FliO [unclassified Sinorhizobium]|uniref:flagellar biosynthetic protein FliO n=1 Tax=unclassified Sinorhizobium TaxID=2613772 RepID=UPI0035249AF5
MYDDLVAAYGNRFFLAVGGVGIALLCLIGIFWIIRNRRAPSPFVRGGRNRQPRLQVLDAAAVDTRRRLVLVRRDDVEHLIMIGGPTDIVIESRISNAEAPVTAVPAFTSKPEVKTTEPSPVWPEPRAVPRSVAPAVPVDEPTPPYVPLEATLESLPRREPILDAEPSVRPAPSPQRERAAAPQPVPERTPSTPPRTAQAVDILDAHRQRVLSQQPQPQPPVTPPAQSLPAAAQGTPVVPDDGNVAPPVAQPRPRELGSDFQRVLEAEMASNLTAERLVPPAGAAPHRASQPSQMPRRDPELPPITGSDAALQKEVARIFGEMSVNRDK